MDSNCCGGCMVPLCCHRCAVIQQEKAAKARGSGAVSYNTPSRNVCDRADSETLEDETGSEAAGHGRVESAAGYFDSGERQDRQMNTSTNAFNAAWARMYRVSIWMREVSSSWNRHSRSCNAWWPAGGRRRIRAIAVGLGIISRAQS